MSNAINPITALNSSTAIDTVATELSSNFVYDDEKWVIDQHDPPTLEQCYSVTNLIVNLKDAANYIEDQSCWLLGNIVLVCRDHFGDNYDPSFVIEATDKSYHTLMTSESVFLGWGDRRVEGLSFTHHKEVHYAKGLSDEQKSLILQKALEHKLTVKETRALTSLVKKDKVDLLEDLDAMDVLNAIEDAKKEKEPLYICVSFNEIVTKVKETALTDDLITKQKIVIQIDPDLEVYKNVQ